MWDCREPPWSAVAPAQGLAEVLAVMGASHLSTLLPDLLANTASKNVFVREGHLTLFKFLPLAMPEVFQVGACLVTPLSVSTSLAGMSGPWWKISMLMPWSIKPILGFQQACSQSVSLQPKQGSIHY